MTGASRGIGAATARALAERGATVVVTGRDESKLRDVAADVGGTHVIADLRTAKAADSLVAQVLGQHGRLDLVVANAGIGYAGEFASMPADRLADVLAVNFTATVHLARACLPALLERQGALVFVTSVAGALLVPTEAAYSAAKAGVEALAEVLRDELVGTGVHVGTVLPGAVRTEFFTTRGAPYDRGFPRPIAPERVAAAVVRSAEDAVPRVVVPGWLRLPILLHRLVPGAYRSLARRYG